MEFLYSLNRLNVATSRARCAVIVVASPAAVRAGVPDAAADAAGERAVPVRGDGPRGVSGGGHHEPSFDKITFATAVASSDALSSPGAVTSNVWPPPPNTTMV